MTIFCKQCGDELLPQTSFCRRCGAPISASLPEAGNEATTRLLDESDAITTQRLDPRPTSPGREPLNVPRTATAVTPRGSKKVLPLTIIVLLLLVGIVATFAIVRHRGDRTVGLIDSLSYPGARKLLDIVSEGGGHAVHFQTPDSFDAVQNWYRSKLQPQKVVQLTSQSSVMKNDKVTATIVREGDQTNVLLKIVP
jgi:hypothetical protein